MRKILNDILNLKAKYFDSKSSAYDEILTDQRDYLSGGATEYYTYTEFQDAYMLTDNQSVNQNREGFEMSCTSQGTCNAINTNIFYQKEGNRQYVSGDNLWDLALEKGIASNKYGAYLIDVIKLAKDEGLISIYYSVLNIESIMNAIYHKNSVATGSSKIDWSKCRDGFVKEIGEGYAHIFTIIGWDKNKRIGKYLGGFICENSYGVDKQFLLGGSGHFLLPFELVEQGILFNTKKALVL